MDFAFSDKVKSLTREVTAFRDNYIYPNENLFAAQTAEGDDGYAHTAPILEDLRQKAFPE
jgi:acyl-CoA dehydrogenase